MKYTYLKNPDKMKESCSAVSVLVLEHEFMDETTSFKATKEAESAEFVLPL